MKLKNEKSVTVLVCFLGVAAVAYGMSRENDLVFIVGLLLIIGAYLFMRKKLKDHIRNKYNNVRKEV